jgi:hypothetical protein
VIHFGMGTDLSSALATLARAVDLSAWAQAAEEPKSNDFWDIFNVIAASVASIGAVAAVVVASMTYRRQVEDELRRAAMKVGVAVSKDHKALIVDNETEYPIYTVSVYEYPDGNNKNAELLEGTGHHKIDAQVSESFNLSYPGQLCVVTFVDYTGRGWQRDSDGEFESRKLLEFRKIMRKLRAPGRPRKPRVIEKRS